MIPDSLRRYAGLVLFVALMTLGSAGLARAAQPCRARASLDLSVGAAWADKAYTDWTATGARTLAAADRISEIEVVNTHTTQALFILWRASAAEATTSVEYLGPGAAKTLDIWELGASTVSFQGAGAATTAKVSACWGRP